MVGQHRQSHRPRGEESQEERRHRMRVAQRKHRARKEQTIADLEEQLDVARAKLDDVQCAFNGLQHAVAQSSCRGSHVYKNDFDPAMDALRAALAGSQDVRSGCTGNIINEFCSPDGLFDSVPLWGSEADPMTASDECPGTFAIQLYEHCTNFAVRILACGQGPLNALAQRLFHHYVLQMAIPEHGSRLDVLRECMEQRATQVAHVSDERGRANMGKIFRKPRIAGFSQYLDVTQVEEYLLTRGFDFNKSPDVAHIIIPGDSSVKSTPDLETDSEDSDDMLDQQNEASSEPWWADAQSFPHTRNASYDGLNMCNDPSLPFGLHDNGDDDAEVLAGFGLPRSHKRAAPNSFDTDCVSMRNRHDCHPAESEVFESVPRQHVIEINISELLKRLVSIGICIGAPGPGWKPEDVSRVADELMEGV